MNIADAVNQRAIKVKNNRLHSSILSYNIKLLPAQALYLLLETYTKLMIV